jgi:predicted nucleic acid-binding protein
VIYLLDVNALVALGFINHEFHDRLAAWVRSHNSPNLASCPITELGFVRVLAQAPAYGFTVSQARLLLYSSSRMNMMFRTCLLGSERPSKLPMVI